MQDTSYRRNPKSEALREENPKFKIPNPKQFQNANFKCSKPRLSVIFPRLFEFWSFGFVWDLGFCA